MSLPLFLLIQAAAPVLVTVKPSTVYIERSASTQNVEFEFLLEGRSDDTVRLTSIKVTAEDASGKPWYIRSVDESAADPSILTLPRREIAGRSTILVYNPFYSFPLSAPLVRLRYEFGFASGDREWKAETSVTPTRYRQTVDLRLPLRGRLLVFEGHDYYAHHRRFDYTHPILRQTGLHDNAGRYAHDLSLVDSVGRMYRGEGKHNEDWLSWGVPILAPGAGRIVEVENGMPDYDVGNPAGGLPLDSILARPVTLMGNHVVIDHGGGVFSRMFHMMRGSVSVKVGDRVVQGQVVGRVGFSGSVYTVHLHYEVATGVGLAVEGLPAYFGGFRRVLGNTTVSVARGSIDTGEIVER